MPRPKPRGLKPHSLKQDRSPVLRDIPKVIVNKRLARKCASNKLFRKGSALCAIPAFRRRNNNKRRVFSII
jgi:hypothetical protein